MNNSKFKIGDKILTNFGGLGGFRFRDFFGVVTNIKEDPPRQSTIYYRHLKTGVQYKSYEQYLKICRCELPEYFNEL